MVSITEIAKDYGFSGSAMSKFAELRSGTDMIIDESSPYENNMNTRIDCYVAGSYIGRDGHSIEIKQRYTIYVAYSAKTQQMAMTKVRAQIMADFERNFPQFHVTDVFIPEDKFVIPIATGPQTEEFYYGSELFKQMSRIDVKRYKLASEKAIYRSRVSTLKKRYG
jgi:hypothetical protein